MQLSATPRSPTPEGQPEQFDRTPFIAGFRAANEHFTLLTAHIRNGSVPADRLPELQRIARFTAQELRARARAGQSREEPNLLVLGDFNIDKRQGNPLFDAFVETGLWVRFAGAVYQELSSAQVSPRVSDHLPLWVEFTTDRSEEGMARVLGVDIDGPEPFAGVLD